MGMGFDRICNSFILLVDWNEFSIHKPKDIDERIIMVISSRLAL